ncbi:hypothetical protein OQA88_2935 [Cercophora sp. LCS_1]
MVLLDTTHPEKVTMLVFPSIALYNVLELHLIIFFTFKTRSGLYFWSFLVATWGLIPQAIAALCETFLPGVIVGPPLATMYIIGWYCMVTGQSLVLYSRLHLLLHNTTTLRLVLAMIIANFFLGHVPPTILAYGKDSGLTSFQRPYAIYEKIQVTLFFTQEVVISALYIKEAVKLIRSRRNFTAFSSGGKAKDRSRELLVHLFIVNVVILVLDVNVLAWEYAGLHNVQTSVKTFVYSAKLKVEFSILNKLVELTRALRFEESEATPVNRVVRIREAEVGGEVGSGGLPNKGKGYIGGDAEVPEGSGNSVFVESLGGGKQGDGDNVVMTTTEVVVEESREKVVAGRVEEV